jgi:hypothetical protein
MSVRTAVGDYLAQVLAGTPGLESVKLVRSIRELGEISKPTLILKTESYVPTAAAPRTSRQGNFIATLVSPHRDLDRAEDQLDDLLELLLPALLTAGILWSDATQVGYGDSNLAYDIHISSILTEQG